MDNVTVPSPRSSNERAQPAPAADPARQCKDAAARCLLAWHYLDRAEFFWSVGESHLAHVNEDMARLTLQPVTSILDVSEGAK